MRDYLRSLGYKEIHDNCFYKYPNKIVWEDLLKMWSISGNLIIEKIYASTKDLPNIIQAIENPRITLLDFLLESYLVLSYFFEKLEPILIKHGYRPSRIKYDSVSYRNNDKGDIIIKWDIGKGCMMLGGKFKIDQDLDPETFENYIK